MDNQYWTQQNAAYRFDLFDTARTAPQKQPERDGDFVPLRVIKTPPAEQPAQKRRSVPRLIKASAFMVALLAMLMFSLFGNARLMVKRSEAVEWEKKLESARQSAIDLESELHRRVAACDIDRYATTKLGMVKLKQSQITYFVFDDEDEVVFVGN